jgi:hypothetical protein
MADFAQVVDEPSAKVNVTVPCAGREYLLDHEVETLIEAAKARLVQHPLRNAQKTGVFFRRRARRRQRRCWRLSRNGQLRRNRPRGRFESPWSVRQTITIRLIDILILRTFQQPRKMPIEAEPARPLNQLPAHLLETHARKLVGLSDFGSIDKHSQFFPEELERTIGNRAASLDLQNVDRVLLQLQKHPFLGDRELLHSSGRGLGVLSSPLGEKLVDARRDILPMAQRVGVAVIGVITGLLVRWMKITGSGQFSSTGAIRGRRKQ